MKYNLLKEQWIPVVGTNGRLWRTGIKEALIQADHIRQIAASNPMDRVAILRFLLALLYWCKGNSPDSENADIKPFPEEWLSKLDENEDCFNLLGDGKRFYQYKRDGDRADLSANYLIHEIPTGTNFWHFRHSMDFKDGLCPSCCALGLLRLPPFSTQGGSGKPPGINGRPPIYVFRESETLEQMLQLLWKPTKNLILGIPSWEKPDMPLPKNGEVPLLTGLTWLPRRVWLDEPSETVARCISCGRQDRLVSRSVFAPIGSTKTDDGESRSWGDPQILTIHKKQGKKEITYVAKGADPLSNYDTAVGEWATMAVNLSIYSRGHTRLVNFASDQNKYFEALDYSLPTGQNTGVESIVKWHDESTSLSRRLQSKIKNKELAPKRKHTEINSAITSIRPHVENQVSRRLSDLLIDGEEAWKDAVHEYDPLLAAVAVSLAPGFTVDALEKRKQILEARPDMNRKPPDDVPKTKTSRKRGK